MSVQTNFSTKNKVDELVGFSLENAVHSLAKATVRFL